MHLKTKNQIRLMLRTPYTEHHIIVFKIIIVLYPTDGG